MAQVKTDKPERPRPVSGVQRRRRQWLIVGAVVVVAAGVVGYFAYRAVAGLPGTVMPDLGNAHIQTLEETHVPYNSDPPTSGPHMPYIAPWGVHTEPVAKELQVHNLEDGGVMVQYHCPASCPELVEKLKAIVLRYKDEVILAPYPGMKQCPGKPQCIALTAWTRIDAFDQFNEGRIVRFINAYRGIDHHKR
ncbi:MAG TPA: DUF3105 domain-containing protein [Methylomirabilota bacterium]|jgi:hypothetical protein|nr:DUF3105 domain-containing protein [Methylomirabilota bacterium]